MTTKRGLAPRAPGSHSALPIARFKVAPQHVAFTDTLPREAEHEVHPMTLAPGHELLAAKARIAADHDAGVRPAFAHPRDDVGTEPYETVSS